MASPQASDVGRLVAALRPGQTGCLRSGRYQGDIVIRHPGAPNAPITLRPYPGAVVRLDGSVDWEPGAHDWRLTGLRIDGANAGSQNTISINTDRIRIDHNDITNENKGASCILIGSLQYGTSRSSVVDHNRIHGCGDSGSASLNHGVYVCCGYGVRVTSNVIYGVSGYGVQLYPDADGSRVDHNIIVGSSSRSGVVFGGDTYGGCFQTQNAAVTSNIIASNDQYGVDQWWGCRPGSGNLVSANCFFANRSGAIDSDHTGMVVGRNVAANPRFRAPARNDFRLGRGSRCAAMTPRGSVGP